MGPRRKQITGMLVVAALIVAVVVGIVVIRQRTSSRGQDLLAEAMVIVNSPVQPPTPAQPPSDGQPGTMETQQPGTYPSEDAKLKAALPRLQAAADAYPNAEAGLIARYHLASSLASMGKHDEALKAYDAVIAGAGDSIYGRMAKLGKANEQARLGQYAPAIETYKALADEKESALPADAILMQLAAAYDASGNKDEAKKTFSRIVHEHPASPYSAEAGKQIQ